MKKWIAHLDNGTTVTSEDVAWKDIKDRVKNVSLDNDGQLITLPDGMDEYGQATTASIGFGSSQITTESRYIYYKLGNIKVIIRVDEKSGNITVECESSE